MDLSPYSRYPKSDSTSILKELGGLDLTGRITLENGVVANGGCGDVRKGTYKRGFWSWTTIAGKQMRLHMSKDEKSMFEKEVFVWAKLRHKNILPLLGYAFEERTGYPILVSEWMENGSAWRFVNSNPACDLIHIITGLASGLEYLHDMSIVHSDVKSDNVLISSSGDALLCDFGFTRTIAASRSFANVSSTLRGTAAYMAPELLGEDTKRCKETDIWAFGMTVFELLARRRPFQQEREARIIMMIRNYELPSLPDPSTLPTSLQATKLLWKICEMCRIKSPVDRADIRDILSLLKEKPVISRISTLRPTRDQECVKIKARSIFWEEISTPHPALEVSRAPFSPNIEFGERPITKAQTRRLILEVLSSSSFFDEKDLGPVENRASANTVSVCFKNTGSSIMQLQFFDSESREMIGELVIPNAHLMIRNVSANIPSSFSIACGRSVKNFSRTFIEDTDIDMEQIFSQF